MGELLAIGSNVVTWSQAHGLLAGVAAGLVLALMVVPPLTCWWVMRRSLKASRDAVSQVEQRLAHLCSAVEMLTDTTESGLQSAFDEIQRLLNNDLNRLAAPQLELRTRGTTAVRTTRDIARREGVSEGEVQLRMKLNASASAHRATPMFQ